MIEADLLRYGYLFVFLGTVVEGDATLLTAAFLAHRGYLKLSTVILVAGLSTLVSSQIYYFVARHSGPSWIGKLRARGPRMETLIDWAARHGNWLTLGSRFSVGFRTAIPLVCGATGMGAVRFFVWNTASAVLWVAAFAWAGYMGGHVTSLLRAYIGHHEWLIAAAGAVVVGGLILWRTHGRELADIWLVRKMLWPDR